MKNPSQSLAVFSHEWHRSIVSKRFVSWIFLIGFPVMIVSLIRYAASVNRGTMVLETWGPIVYILVPCMCCMLSLLLTASPVLQAELEGRSWIYLAVRPGAKDALLVGKHMYASSRTILTAVISLIVCLWIGGFLAEIRFLMVMLALIVLSSIAYGAVYLFIGVLIPRRAMVVAVIFSAVEFWVSLAPAMINRLTVQYRLRSLLIDWMNWDDLSSGWLADASVFFSQVPWWQHVVVLIGMTVALLIAASIILNRREYIAIRDE